jgi:hypothetical protein
VVDRNDLAAARAFVDFTTELSQSLQQHPVNKTPSFDTTQELSSASSQCVIERGTIGVCRPQLILCM